MVPVNYVRLFLGSGKGRIEQVRGGGGGGGDRVKGKRHGQTIILGRKGFWFLVFFFLKWVRAAALTLSPPYLPVAHADSNNNILKTWATGEYGGEMVRRFNLICKRVGTADLLPLPPSPTPPSPFHQAFLVGPAGLG